MTVEDVVLGSIQSPFGKFLLTLIALGLGLLLLTFLPEIIGIIVIGIGIYIALHYLGHFL